METAIKSYLCRSAPVQKGLPKLLILYQGERSQDGAVMCRREEARQLHSGGYRVGLPVARVSALCTKREFPASEELPERSMRVPSPASRVTGDVTWGKRLVSSTGEVLRCPRFLGETPTYKASSKMVGLRNGEEKRSLLASSLRMAADPEYLPFFWKGKVKPQRVRRDARSHETS
jgi:hypothetical protein